MSELKYDEHGVLIETPAQKTKRLNAEKAEKLRADKEAADVAARVIEEKKEKRTINTQKNFLFFCKFPKGRYYVPDETGEKELEILFDQFHFKANVNQARALLRGKYAHRDYWPVKSFVKVPGKEIFGTKDNSLIDQSFLHVLTERAVDLARENVDEGIISHANEGSLASARDPEVEHAIMNQDARAKAITEMPASLRV